MRLFINFSTKNNLLSLFTTTWIATNFPLVHPFACLIEVLINFNYRDVYIMYQRKSDNNLSTDSFKYIKKKERS